MRNLVGVGLLACWGLIACGGKLVDSGTRASAGAFSAGAPGGGAPASGGSNAGGSVADGGSVSSGGGFPTQICVGDDFVTCAASCGSEQSMALRGECQGGKWSCPAPFVDPESCPEDACVRQLISCCDHRYGRRTLPPCAQNGRFGACAAGFERDASICVADSAHTTDCSTLFDQSCTLEDALCERQGVHCQCAPKDGGLAWHCGVDLL
jgi:hypothetical protein